MGTRGEFAVSTLHSHAEKPVLPTLAIDGVAPTLLLQTQQWLRYFFAACQIRVNHIPRAKVMLLRIGHASSPVYLRTGHAGYAITQILPIIAAGLSAKPDDILLIEYPEANLHPKGQGMMARFLAWLASAGVQIIVETHSEHILNGLRRRIKSGDLDCNDLAILYLRQRTPRIGHSIAQIEMPKVDSNGHLDYWPKGFF